MNIFYLDRDPKRCAEMHCDKHVVKMILEYAQLLSTAHHEIDGKPSIECYKPTHRNHPSAVWARANRSNYSWLHLLLQDLCSEYTLRYGKVHKTEERGIVRGLSYPPYEMPSGDFFDPPQCMPDHCKDKDAVLGYRNYYIREKSYMARWKNTDAPPWYKIGLIVGEIIRGARAEGEAA